MELSISSENRGSACVVRLSGEVDVYTSPQLKQELVALSDSACEHVVVDMEKLDFIDSSGLGVLVGGLRRMKERDGTLRLVCPKDSILKIFRITGLDRVFPLFTSVEEALDF